MREQRPGGGDGEGGDRTGCREERMGRGACLLTYVSELRCADWRLAGVLKKTDKTCCSIIRSCVVYSIRVGIFLPSAAKKKTRGYYKKKLTRKTLTCNIDNCLKMKPFLFSVVHLLTTHYFVFVRFSLDFREFLSIFPLLQPA